MQTSIGPRTEQGTCRDCATAKRSEIRSTADDRGSPLTAGGDRNGDLAATVTPARAWINGRLLA